MKFEPGLRIEQKLHLSPQMQYTLILLQMDTTALLQHIKEQAMENPLISLENLPVLRVPQISDSDESIREIPDTHTRNTLHQSLHQQIPLSLSKDEEWVVKQLIDSLDPSGYLGDTPERLAKDFGVSMALMEQELKTLRNMSPPGIGATSLSECFILQLKRIPEAPPLAQRIAEHYLEDIAAGHLRKIARKENVPLHCVEEALSYIRTLSPVLDKEYDQNDPSIYCTPDIIVTYEDRKLCVSLTEQASPVLAKNPVYMDMLANIGDPAVRTYLKERAASLTKLEQAIAMRSQTLLSVARVIVTKQKQFFTGDQQALTPLSLKDISLELGLHISTVSRAIQDKYLICSKGMFPLRHFLSRYIPGTSDANTSADGQDHVLRIIQDLIKAEDPRSPLSDQQIFDKLQADGISISRRSVVNYREKLSIPSSYVRRRNLSR